MLTNETFVLYSFDKIVKKQKKKENTVDFFEFKNI